MKAMRDSLGEYTEERLIHGESVTTPELHEARCNENDPACHCIADGKWCFKASSLRVAAPNSKWVFVGQPTLECTRDNDGSAAWNALGAPDRYFVTFNNPNEIRATILTSSRSIAVRLNCLARFYPG
jgi:hypothetical protein